jgi:hypothetical protein
MKGNRSPYDYEVASNVDEQVIRDIANFIK